MLDGRDSDIEVPDRAFGASGTTEVDDEVIGLAGQPVPAPRQSRYAGPVDVA